MYWLTHRLYLALYCTNTGKDYFVSSLLIFPIHSLNFSQFGPLFEIFGIYSIFLKQWNFIADILIVKPIIYKHRYFVEHISEEGNIGAISFQYLFGRLERSRAIFPTIVSNRSRFAAVYKCIGHYSKWDE